MRFSKEDKLNMYKLRKQGYTYSYIENLYGIKKASLKYLIKVIDNHGVKWLYRPYKKWTTEEKQTAIDRVLLYGESRRSVAIDLGLSSIGMLTNWISSYQKNGYNIVDKPIGRPRKNSTMTKKKQPISSEAKRIKDLEKENLYLKAEIAYLKELRNLRTAQQKKK